MKAFLVLEDGKVYVGEHFGANKSVICEVVFNTSLEGYTEFLTDPSYAAQGVVLTFPTLGNHGVFSSDFQCPKLIPTAIFVRETDVEAPLRSDFSFTQWVKESGVVGMKNLDTRALTKHLRDNGSKRGKIVLDSLPDDLSPILDELAQWEMAFQVPLVSVQQVESCEPKQVGIGSGMRIAVLDYGAKNAMVDCFLELGCTVDILPFETSAQDILDKNYDGLLLANGPGDPKQCKDQIEEIKKLYDSDLPIFAICLGHQLLALSQGFETGKMKFGHRGANHPVRFVDNGKIYITSQNHGYYVLRESIDSKKAEVLFEHVQDNTVEGLRYLDRQIISVQFHPEAAPGPLDTRYLFKEFIENISRVGSK